MSVAYKLQALFREPKNTYAIFVSEDGSCACETGAADDERGSSSAHHGLCKVGCRGVDRLSVLLFMISVCLQKARREGEAKNAHARRLPASLSVLVAFGWKEGIERSVDWDDLFLL